MPAVLFSIPIVLGLVLCAVLFAVIVGYIGEWLFRRQMIQAGRYLSRRELAKRLAAGGTGTLILNSSTIGWGIAQAWWTDDILPPRESLELPAPTVACAYPIPGYDDHPWNQQWCCRTYTSPEEGKAMLLQTRRGQSVEKWLRRQGASFDVVWVSSALGEYVSRCIARGDAEESPPT